VLTMIAAMGFTAERAGSAVSIAASALFSPTVT
jgi:hypothetical protein